MFLRDEYTRTIMGGSSAQPPGPAGVLAYRRGKELSGAVPAIENESGRTTLPVGSAVLGRAQDMVLFLAFLA